MHFCCLPEPDGYPEELKTSMPAGTPAKVSEVHEPDLKYEKPEAMD